MIEIDGASGEGGGQMLRTALSLSCLTGKPFRMRRIRQGRAKPGLMRQHQVAVQAAARIAAAEASGAEIGSSELVFIPGKVRSGDYDIDIGTAGSIPLVLQTLIPPLLFASGPSRLCLSGGTHVPFSPSWQYLAEVFAPALGRLGVRLDLQLESCGFYPRGGGRVRCHLKPVGALAPLHAEERGELERIRALAAVAHLPRSIAQRELDSATELLTRALGRVPLQVELAELRSPGAGTFLFLKGEYLESVSGFLGLGARGKPAELVGAEAADQFLAHHDTGCPVDPHLADQLVLYLALAPGESRFATSRITNHLETNLQVARLFVEFHFECLGERDRPGRVRIVGGKI